MKLLSFAFAILPLALAAQRLSTFMVTYPEDTPGSAINQDMQDIVDAGGVISHEFHMFNGFTAQAPPDALHSLSTLSSEHKPTIEEDSIVTAYDGEN
ncbi:hypothetical protein PHISP_07644 [Aspergillus sp. HF37]|nr:hypothetical protein PHISP_07644 [Aspergillus sp. HF37]